MLVSQSERNYSRNQIANIGHHKLVKTDHEIATKFM